MSKRKKNNVLAGLVVLAFVGMIVVGINKNDNMPNFDNRENSLTVVGSAKMDTTEVLWVVVPRDKKTYYIDPSIFLEEGVSD